MVTCDRHGAQHQNGTLWQTSQGQFGVEWDIWREQLACAGGGRGHAPPGNVWNFGTKWCNLTHFDDIYPRPYLHRQLVILTLEQIGARSAELLIEFTARQSNACDSQTAAWERDTTDECVRLVRSAMTLFKTQKLEMRSLKMILRRAERSYFGSRTVGVPAMCRMSMPLGPITGFTQIVFSFHVSATLTKIAI